MTPLALQLAVEEDKVTPGLLGFTVVAVLAVATWLLLKSMTKQLKRVDFDESATDTRRRPAARPDGTAAEGTGGAADSGDTEGADGAVEADKSADKSDDADDSDTAGRRETQGNGAK